MEEQKWNEIDRYLLLEMEEEERLTFEQKMEKDATLKQAVEEQQLLIKAFEQRGNQILKEELEIIYQDRKSQNTNLSRRMIPWTWLSVAASILLIIGLGYWLLPQPANNLNFAQHFSPYELTALRGEENGDYLNEFETLYNQGKYKEVITHYNGNLKSTNDDKIRIALGVSYLAQGLTKEARKQFEIAQKNPLFYDSATWYIGLSYLKEKDEKSMQKVFQELVKNTREGNPYHIKAAEFIK